MTQNDSGSKFSTENLPKLRDVVCPVGELTELYVFLAMCPDLVHHGIRGLLCEDDGLSHVVIVMLNEIALVTQNWFHCDFWG